MTASSRVPVIGLAGGIGAGKSAVAGLLAARGCAVVDSDAQARAQLDLPEVRDQLVAWWGPHILGPDARVSRAQVARIVFADPHQRRRLEALIHPRVRIDRAQAFARAVAAGARACVIDAPLLFEAGLDAECDAVIFVDTPRPERLARVAARGWDQAELDRREAAQWPLDDKRRRCGYAVLNSGDLAALQQQVDRVLESILARAAP